MPRVGSASRCHAVMLCIGLGVAGFVGQGSVSAQEAASLLRVFQLRDGSVVRGQLIERIPGERVVLALPDGRVLTLTWAELMTGEALNGEDEVMPARITANRPVEIYERPRDGEERLVVSTPTGASADPATYRDGSYVQTWLRRRSEFRIGGPNVTSLEYRPSNAGGVDLQITAGSRARNIAGVILLMGGGIIAAGGFFTTLGGLAVTTSESSAPAPPGWLPLSTQLYISGGVLLVGGVVGVLSGWRCYATSKTTLRETLWSASSPSGATSGTLAPASGMQP